MANPLVPGGTLNRLLAALSVLDSPELNATSGYLGSELINVTFEGSASDYIENLASATPSPRPFQVASIVVHLLKSQPLSAAWEQQRLTNTSIGDVVITPDSPTLPPYYFSNCTLQNVESLAFTGATNDFPVMIRGTYYINADLFS